MRYIIAAGIGGLLATATLGGIEIRRRGITWRGADSFDPSNFAPRRRDRIRRTRNGS
jgi:hypothetical protein